MRDVLKYIGFILIIYCMGQQVHAQKISVDNTSFVHAVVPIPEGEFITPNPDFLTFSEHTKLISVNSSDIYFQRTYLVNEEGQTLSSGFMSSSYFSPNDNLIVISGHADIIKDSFNPYGAYDMPSMIVLATFNNFISRLKINRR